MKEHLITLFKNTLKTSNLIQLHRLISSQTIQMQEEEIKQQLSTLTKIENFDNEQIVEKKVPHSLSGFEIKDENGEPYISIGKMRIELCSDINQGKGFFNYQQKNYLINYYKTTIKTTPFSTKSYFGRSYIKVGSYISLYVIYFGSILEEISEKEYQQLEQQYLNKIKQLDKEELFNRLEKHNKD